MIEKMLNPLSKEETTHYFTLLAAGDNHAKSKLVEHNLRLVVYVARKFLNTGQSLEDLVSIGTIGLIKAVKGFDINLNNQFATYATRCIENEILMNIRKTSKTSKELSLDEHIEGEDNNNLTRIDRIVDEKASSFYQDIEKREIYNELHKCVESLDEQSSLIICMLYGLNGYERHTQREVADVLGLSRSYISRLEVSILKEIRKNIETGSVEKAAMTKKIYNYFYSIDFDKFLSLYGEQFEDLTDVQKDNIKLFYNIVNYNEDSVLSLEEVERQINISKFPFLMNPSKIGNDKLNVIYQKNRDKFTEFHQKVIACFLLKTCSLTELVEEYHTTIPILRATWLYQRIKLEQMYFNIDNKEMTKIEVSNILNNQNYNISDLHRKIISMHRGIDYDKEYKVKEIALILNFPYVKVHDSLMYIEEKMYELLYEISYHGVKRDTTDYDKYICNSKYDFTEQTRELLKKHIIEDQSYEELSQYYNLSKYQISNLVTEGIRKINFYRHGIIKELLIDQDEIAVFMKKFNYEDNIKEIIVSRYIEKKEYESISKAKKLSVNVIKGYITQFEYEFIKHKYDNVSIDGNDYLREINSHTTDTVLEEIELKIISLLFGIKSKYNIDGRVYSKKEIIKLLNIRSTVYTSNLCNANLKVLKRKVGLNDPRFGIIDQDTLTDILKDIRLPLSAVEIEMLKHLKQVDNYSYLDTRELAKKYSITEGSLFRRYQRAMLTIKQYQSSEIEGQYDYENDIFPNLKFFPKDYRMVIEAKYKDNLTGEAISILTNDTIHQIRFKLKNIKVQLAAIIKKDSNFIKIDYDKMEDIVDKKDLLLFGKRKLKILVFKMFYGLSGYSRQTIPEIIKNLELKTNTTVVSKHISDVLLSIEKYKVGIKNKHCFTSEELIQYYEKNKLELTYLERRQMLSYIEKENKQNEGDIQTIYGDHTLPFSIRYKVACYLYGKIIDINNVSKEEIIRLLNGNSPINFAHKISLIKHLNFNSRDLMKNPDKNKTLKILLQMFNQQNKAPEQEETHKQLRLGVNNYL